MNKYTIFENEEELLIEQNCYNDSSPMLKILQETQGIVDCYYSISNELYDAISDVEAIPNDPKVSYLIYVLNGYKLKQDCFISDINIRVLAGEKGKSYFGSYFLPRENDITLSKNGKLKNCTLTIGIHDNNIKTNNSRNEFFQVVAHELQHAFRYYNICNSNNSAKENEKKIRTRYGNAVNMIIRDSDTKLERRIVLATYSLDKNEVMSECNKLYEYIRQHEEINSSNFKNYLDDMPLYFRINQADRNISELDEYLYSKDKEKINQVGNIWKNINNVTNITNEKAFLIYRFDLIAKETFIKRVFYRTLNKALDDFSRRINNVNIVEIIERRNNFDGLDEILREI